MAIMSQININRLVLAMETPYVFCDCISIYLFFCVAQQHNSGPGCFFFFLIFIAIEQL